MISQLNYKIYQILNKDSKYKLHKMKITTNAKLLKQTL